MSAKTTSPSGTLSRPAAWATFARERFQIPAVLIFGVAQSTSAQYVVSSTLDWLGLAISVAGIAVLLVVMRMMDELKDLDKDRIAHPARPLPRGLISPEEVRSGLRIAIGLLLVVSVFIGLLWNPVAGVLLGLSVGYSLLMSRVLCTGSPRGTALLVCGYASNHHRSDLCVCDRHSAARSGFHSAGSLVRCDRPGSLVCSGGVQKARPGRAPGSRDLPDRCGSGSYHDSRARCGGISNIRRIPNRCSHHPMARSAASTGKPRPDYRAPRELQMDSWIRRPLRARSDLRPHDRSLHRSVAMTLQPLGPDSPAEALAARAGGKAAQLAILGRLGCSVPSWFCIPVEGFDAAFAEAQEQLGGTADTVPAGVSSLPVPKKVAELIPEALAQYSLSDAFVAIRSSGLDEDGTEHSFAGQFESYLYRRGADAIVEAIGRCWASAFSERNVAYRRAIGKPDSVPRMGVVIQQMIDSESAGVAFSRNPLAPGDRDALIVESVWGQGEGIVS